ncbi:hypothetical protein HPP92_010383 [Vanilla planifolia]|uniref:WW domain-containing protein n=1 Tax=Vanilla planifolia TaxID=51239 RepID=A0A835R0S8_VANPL|nr:hypothetical protein HPP92_010383 [Vanilla planifolia]
MAAAEAAQTSLGPSFAPEDPSLPKPWKGLIDGSTGVLYYWNPETNVTQYEKPAGSAPPVPPGPPLASTLQLAPVITSNSTPSNGPSSQQPTEQQTFQQPFEHVQQLQQNQLQPSVQQIPLQQLHQQPYQQLQSVHGQPPLQISQQPSQQYSHLQHLPFHQAPYIQGQNISRPQGQFQYQPGPHAFQFPYQQGQQPKSLQPLVGQELNESQAAHQLGQQLQGSQQSEQQVQRLQASNTMHEPGQKSQSPTAVQQYGMQPHVQNFLKQQDMLQQGPQPSQQQLPQIGFPRVGDSAHQEGRLAGSSSLLNRLLTICCQV